jgi:hypothetical protein
MEQERRQQFAAEPVRHCRPTPAAPTRPRPMRLSETLARYMDGAAPAPPTAG